MQKKKTSITTKILFALIIGIIFGLVANITFPQEVNSNLSKFVLEPVGNIFLRGIKMLVVPLVLFSLICGAASVGDIKKLGRVGGKIFTYYMFTTAFAITIALFLANLLKPGVGIQLPAATAVKAAKAPFIMDIFVNMVPTNPIEAMVKGDMLQIIVFAILFGVAMTLIGDPVKPLLNIMNQANSVLLRMIGIIMVIAPYGVFALISNVVMSQGLKVLIPLLKYFFVCLFVMVLHVLFVYGGALKVIGKLNPITFFKKFWPVMVVALSTSSSNATIPVNLETCESKLGVSKTVSSFTIPLGATINMDGTAIMQGVAAIFISQIYGVNLSLQQQIMIILISTLASIGTAGVPSAGVVMLSMVLQQVGLPLEGVALVLSIDRLVDMARTTVNITGDAIGTLIVANSEGELNLDLYNNETVNAKVA
ncbi:Na+/H+-dicarboxylate symporter [Clostridium tetanomorphum]|uniref:Dicarboxylate/amino acid:cation symporter n=1 Tax=Clostridium tetanomorphum TaxID=1553 RepID=A0A923J220_CLOTT|nr:dicarboxylate/amino acid:cation symporter [Clostridium tetanomorphum]KAJ48961.1 sodium:dicarboxylate symporter family protein [Clostridium tetanomorphum DSM 665]KAJ51320.1 sodium:dicarboxylate symporter family protein [Clostridium tetanomorphum DSM 665]MBC2399821.1 dicarboxylate/amino acid:cation symporter [Clostridium tetanomorphum]MBP1865985.1 Na+/H+-dicarboxylate symporter [Clostridium tetanomorphum]NRS85961.1 Na+/H+-dicarboxylate symporter [Clostridium tetanomorphum]